MRQRTTETLIPRCTGSSSHDWHVVSTILDEVSLLVQCPACGTVGLVYEPTKEEWSEAFHAPEKPYPWPDESRVRVRLPS